MKLNRVECVDTVHYDATNYYHSRVIFCNLLITDDEDYVLVRQLSNSPSSYTKEKVISRYDSYPRMVSLMKKEY